MLLSRNFSHKSVLFVLFACLTLYSSPDSRSCTVKSMVGTVKVRRASSSNWRNARLRMPLVQKDAIRTLLESNVELETSEGTVIKVGENTTMELDILTGEGKVQNTKLKVLNGTVMANVKKLINSKSDFTFETPTATAAIRGTVLDLDVNSNRTVVRVIEGKVWVAPLGSKKGIELNDQQMTVVEKGQKDVVVMEIPKDSIQDSSSTAPQSDSTSSADSTVNVGNGDQMDSLSSKTAQEDLTDSSAAESDSPAVDTSETTDSLKVDKPDIGLEVISPQENSTFTSGEAVKVAGKVKAAQSKVFVNGKTVQVQPDGAFKTVLQAPPKEGEYQVRVLADYNSTQERIARQITVFPASAGLTLISPIEGQVFTKPLVKISGKGQPGSSITIAGIRLNTAADGSFSGEVPIPDEEGDVQLEIEMLFENGKSVKQIRKVSYSPEFRFVLQSPADGQIFYTNRVPLKGVLLPSKAVLTLDGRQVPVSSTGAFSVMHTIPEEEGELRLEFEAMYGEKLKKEVRTVVYKSPADVHKPVLQGVLPEVSRSKKLAFTIIDRTPEEEIVFYSERDGIRESESGPANSPFYLILEDGIHTYSVYAVDKFGNKTPQLKRNVAYLESPRWYIRLINPAGDKVINIPPSAPDLSFSPRLTIDLSVENLPYNDPALIKEVVVINNATGEKVYRKNLTSIDVDCDIVLDRRQPNKIMVQVRDINDIVKSRQFTVHIR